MGLDPTLRASQRQRVANAVIYGLRLAADSVRPQTGTYSMNPIQKIPIEYTETTEQKRLNHARENGVPWKKWGPYLSERQWCTVREDYRNDGNAWVYLIHDQARYRAYRLGDDVIVGVSGITEILYIAVAVGS